MSMEPTLKTAPAPAPAPTSTAITTSTTSTTPTTAAGNSGDGVVKMTFPVPIFYYEHAPPIGGKNTPASEPSMYLLYLSDLNTVCADVSAKGGKRQDVLKSAPHDCMVIVLVRSKVLLFTSWVCLTNYCREEAAPKQPAPSDKEKKDAEQSSAVAPPLLRNRQMIGRHWLVTPQSEDWHPDAKPPVLRLDQFFAPAASSASSTETGGDSSSSSPPFKRGQFVFFSPEAESEMKASFNEAISCSRQESGYQQLDPVRLQKLSNLVQRLLGPGRTSTSSFPSVFPPPSSASSVPLLSLTPSVPLLPFTPPASSFTPPAPPPAPPAPPPAPPAPPPAPPAASAPAAKGGDAQGNKEKGAESSSKTAAPTAPPKKKRKQQDVDEGQVKEAKKKKPSESKPTKKADTDPNPVSFPPITLPLAPPLPPVSNSLPPPPPVSFSSLPPPPAAPAAPPPAPAPTLNAAAFPSPTDARTIPPPSRTAVERRYIQLKNAVLPRAAGIESLVQAEDPLRALEQRLQEVELALGHLGPPSFAGERQTPQQQQVLDYATLAHYYRHSLLLPLFSLHVCSLPPAGRE